MENEKTWITPELTVFGSVKDITKQSIPPKVYGSADGATWQNQDVTWGS